MNDRIKARSAGRVLVALLGCAAALPLSGCDLTQTTVPVRGAIIGTTLAYVANTIPAGPRVTFVNESALTLHVRYWSGRRDTTAPAGVADIRTGDDMAFRALPGDFFITQAGRAWWPTSMSDAVIRARIEIESPEGEHHAPIWIELEQPRPFKFTATGDSVETLEFRRYGGGAIVPVPRDQWIDGHNGPFPVDGELAAK